MTEYTPTEDDLREALNHWLLVNRSADRRKFNGREGALDRFLAKERADAWDECLRTVVPKFIEVIEIMEERPSGFILGNPLESIEKPRNPYREEQP